MQIFRYMIYIRESYEKEEERREKTSPDGNVSVIRHIGINAYNPDVAKLRRL